MFDELIRIMDEVLRPLGWKRKKTSWFLESEECGGTVNLQKSQIGEEYYINWGISIKVEGFKPFLTYYKRHINARLPCPSECVAEYRKALRGNGSMSASQREAILHHAILTYLLPMIQRLLTVEGVRSALSKNELREAICVGEVIQHLRKGDVIKIANHS